MASETKFINIQVEFPKEHYESMHKFLSESNQILTQYIDKILYSNTSVQKNIRYDSDENTNLVENTEQDN